VRLLVLLHCHSPHVFLLSPTRTLPPLPYLLPRHSPIPNVVTKNGGNPYSFLANYLGCNLTDGLLSPVDYIAHRTPCADQPEWCADLRDGKDLRLDSLGLGRVQLWDGTAPGWRYVTHGRLRPDGSIEQDDERAAETSDCVCKALGYSELKPARHGQPGWGWAEPLGAGAGQETSGGGGEGSATASAGSIASSAARATRSGGDGDGGGGGGPSAERESGGRSGAGDDDGTGAAAPQPVLPAAPRPVPAAVGFALDCPRQDAESRDMRVSRA
jgi:hypothetical protein